MIRLRLYVTGCTPSAEQARAGLRDLQKRLAAHVGKAGVHADVIDVLEDPETAARDQVFATPTLARLAPGAQIRLFGAVSSPDKLLRGLKLDLAELPLAQSA